MNSLASRNAQLEEENAKLRAELDRLRPPAVDHIEGRVLFAITSPDGTQRVVGFDQDVIKVGRGIKSHIVLDDPGVGRMHAVVECTPDGANIVCLGNDGGVHVNGRRVVSTRGLTPGDRITICGFQLVYGRR